MIGGPGWTCQRVTSFFGGRQWYGIPCGAVEKDGHPLGRVVHDYGFFQHGSYSINAAHDNTSVRYDSIRKRVLVLRDVCWYIKADLESGFRQFGTHPFDWRLQVYCNGLDEHYIDIACPFGKTNSTLEFCPPVKLFAISVAVRYWEERGGPVPKLSSYVDDIYGGIPHSNCYESALGLREFLCSEGAKRTYVFNKKPHKTPLPARQQVILGCLYDSTSRTMKSSPSKVTKYVKRIEKALLDGEILAKELMSLHGNLCFAANVTPYGKPFLAVLSDLLIGHKKQDVIKVDRLAKLALRI